jgi:hypothetical protein
MASKLGNIKVSFLQKISYQTNYKRILTLSLILAVAALSGIANSSSDEVVAENKINIQLDDKHNITFSGREECFEQVLSKKSRKALVDKDLIELTYASSGAGAISQQLVGDELHFITPDPDNRTIAKVGVYESKSQHYYGLIPFQLVTDQKPTYGGGKLDATLHGTIVVDSKNGIHLAVANGTKFLEKLEVKRDFEVNKGGKVEKKSGSAFLQKKIIKKMDHPDKNLDYLIKCVGNLIDADKLNLSSEKTQGIKTDEQASSLFNKIKKLLVDKIYQKNVENKHVWRIESDDQSYVQEKLKNTKFPGNVIITPGQDHSNLTQYFSAEPISKVRRAKANNKPSAKKKIKTEDTVKKIETRKTGAEVNKSPAETLRMNDSKRYSAIKLGLSKLSGEKNKKDKNDPSKVTSTIASGMGRFVGVSTFNYSVMKVVLEKIQPSHEGAWRIFDPFGGWGDRMIAASMLSEKYPIEAYKCNDVNKSMDPVYAKLKDFLTDKTKMDISYTIASSEDIKVDDIKSFKPNLIITSPPYPGYNGVAPEMYSEDPEQSYIKYKTLQEWRDNFMKKWVYNCLEALDVDGFLVINIADCTLGGICRYLIDQVEEYYSHDNHIASFMGALGYGLNNTARTKGEGPQVAMEPVFIWQKKRVVPKVKLKFNPLNLSKNPENEIDDTMGKKRTRLDAAEDLESSPLKRADIKVDQEALPGFQMDVTVKLVEDLSPNNEDNDKIKRSGEDDLRIYYYKSNDVSETTLKFKKSKTDEFFD